MPDDHSIAAVVLDWAGTLVDHGSRAPMGAFVESFAAFGVALSIEQARGPMGMAKRPHIAALLALPDVAHGWERVHGAPPDDAAIDAIYADFVPRNIAVAAAHARAIPGAADSLAWLRARGTRIGSTTGYTRAIMEEVLPVAQAQGVVVENLVCAGETCEGRPSPLMMWRSLVSLGVWPAWRAVKFDDTTVGVAEGVNAGAWSIGCALSGNCAGLSEEELAGLSSSARSTLREAAGRQLRDAGAHEVIDSIADLPDAIGRIEQRVLAGEKP